MQNMQEMAQSLVPRCHLKKPICFTKQSNISKESQGYKDFRSSQAEYWKAVAENRMKTAQARRKFTDLSSAEIMKRWEKWDEETIDRLRVQFQMIDINEDGIINFNELCVTLDLMSDDSTMEERLEFYNELDVDHEDGVDFEEFLEFMNKAQSDDIKSAAMVRLSDAFCSVETSTVSGIKRIPVKLLLQHKIF